MRLRVCVVAVAVGAFTADLASAQSSTDGQRDFDFEIGTWRTELRRLERPLSGTSNWLEYEGTSVVREVSGGRANLVELDVTGSAGRIVGASLRLYNPTARQWSLHYANMRNGLLTRPVTGAFQEGRGEFHGEETLDGRAILVRFVIIPLSADSIRFEQSFSADGARTWELNWVAIDTRVKSVPTKPRGSPEQEVLETLYASDDAADKRQRATLERLTADEYLWHASNGVVQTKEATIAETMAGGSTWAVRKYDGLKVRIYGDVAIVTGTFSIAGTSATYRAGPRLITRLFVRRDGRWQDVGGQATLLPSG
jgi:hypothetical protein